MSKFHVEFELQGLKLKIDGERADVPQIAQSIGRQFADILTPIVRIADKTADDSGPPVVIDQAAPLLVSGKKRVRRAAGAKSVTATDAAPLPEWRHDPAKYGAPSQSWSTKDKAIWLLHVLSGSTPTKELSGVQIANVFNKNFRQAGTITSSNVNRDLGTAKVANPPLVGEDAGKTPSNWFLYDAGTKYAEKLSSAGPAKVV